VARGWGSIAREAARTAAYVAAFGLIAYFGIKAVIKIETTQTRLFFVSIVFGVAFGIAVLLDYLLRGQVPTDTPAKGEPTKIWPR
jgi:xanthine/uracil permease